MHLRLKYIVPQQINGVIRRKAIFEAIKFKDDRPVRKPEGGFENELAADGKPLIASLLLGSWHDGTGLLQAIVRRGSTTKTVENFVLSKPNDFAVAELPDGAKSQVARTVSGYHAYVNAEVEHRLKDGKPITGTDGREVLNIVDPEWVLFQSASGTYNVPSAESVPAHTGQDLDHATEAAAEPRYPRPPQGGGGSSISKGSTETMATGKQRRPETEKKPAPRHPGSRGTYLRRPGDGEEVGTKVPGD
jgi:hypothetical protein